jgi:membrane protease YdiL (CAAX protease family)
MNQPEEPHATTSDEDFSVPWSVADTWLGLFIFVLVIIGQLVIAIVWHGAHSLQSVGLVVAELLYLVPVIYILARRKVPWKTLGFRAFNKDKLALGCGLLVAAYLFIVAYNSILALSGVTTQGEAIYKVFVVHQDNVDNLTNEPSRHRRQNFNNRNHHNIVDKHA